MKWLEISGMSGPGWKLLEMALNDWKLQEIVGMAGNEWKLIITAGNDWKTLE